MDGHVDEPFLMPRNAAAVRYGLSVRGLEELYKRYPDFPIVRIGRKVMVHRERADEWFTKHLFSVIE